MRLNLHAFYLTVVTACELISTLAFSKDVDVCLPANRFFSMAACSVGEREWKLRGGSPGLSGGRVSLSS